MVAADEGGLEHLGPADPQRPVGGPFGLGPERARTGSRRWPCWAGASRRSSSPRGRARPGRRGAGARRLVRRRHPTRSFVAVRLPAHAAPGRGVRRAAARRPPGAARRAAQALQATRSAHDEHPQELAHHHQRAGELEAAVTLWMRPARRQAAIAAHVEAIRTFELVLRHLAELDRGLDDLGMQAQSGLAASLLAAARVHRARGRRRLRPVAGAVVAATAARGVRPLRAVGVLPREG